MLFFPMSSWDGRFKEDQSRLPRPTARHKCIPISRDRRPIILLITASHFPPYDFPLPYDSRHHGRFSSDIEAQDIPNQNLVITGTRGDG